MLKDLKFCTTERVFSNEHAYNIHTFYDNIIFSRRVGGGANIAFANVIYFVFYSNQKTDFNTKCSRAADDRLEGEEELKLSEVESIAQDICSKHFYRLGKTQTNNIF